MARPKKDLTIEIKVRTAEEQVNDLAAAGHTRAFISNWLGVNQYHIDEGQLSDAYQLGRVRAENDLLAKAHQRALNDSYRGADNNLWNLLRMVYGYREQGPTVTDTPITLILCPEPPNGQPT
jgi:hypothetical protein